MEEQELKVLNLIKDKDYAPMKAKEIAMIMHVPKSEYNELLRILGKLEMELKIQKNRKNRYRFKSRKRRAKGIPKWRRCYNKNQK